MQARHGHVACGRTTRRSKFACRSFIIGTTTALLVVASLAQPSWAQSASLPGSFAVGSSGSATYKIPIAVPPGTGGVSPSLSIDYDSQGGNGLLGVGWSLGGLPSVGRCPRTFAQDGVRGGVNFDANDRFCFEGQRLLAVSGTYGADGTEYRTEIDSYSKVISHGAAGTGPAWFEVRTKTGQIMEFGNTSDSRVLAQGKTTARSWALNKVSDTKSNYYTVSYTNDTTNGQAYPIEINYTGNTTAGLAPYNKAQFVYEARPDKEPAYHAGSVLRITMRLTNVKTYANGAQVADYQLAYQSNAAPQRSRLASISLCSAIGGCVPATSITWENNTPGSMTQAMSPSGVLLQHSNGTFGFYSGDFNGDGKTDILRWSDTFSQNALLFSNGDGTFSQATNFNLVGHSLQQSNNTLGVQLGDFNGDGKTDILAWSDNITQHALYLSNGDGTFTDVTNFNLVNQYLHHANGSYGFRLGDFNGDGMTDLLRWSDTVSQNALFLSNGDGTFGQAGSFNLTNWLLQHSNGTYGFQIADFNGDGKADILRWSDATTANAVFLSNGDGTFAHASNFNLTNVLLQHSNRTYGFQLGDVNGDGKTDIVLGSDAAVANYVFFSAGDGSFVWAPAFNLGGQQLQHSNNTIGFALGDFNGDGKADILRWSDNITQHALFLSKENGEFAQTSVLSLLGQYLRHSNGTYGFQIGDFNGDGNPDVLRWSQNPAENALFQPEFGSVDVVTSVAPSVGAATSITYSPITNSSIYSKDSTGAYPVIDLNAPIFVVTQVDRPNGVGGVYSTTYRYAGAKADLSGRGFLGFRQMSVTDPQTGIVDTTSYLQSFPYVGAVGSTTRKLASQILNEATNTYQFVNAGGGSTIGTPSNTSAPYRVSLTQRVETRADLDNTAMPSSTTNFIYDAYGNATQVAVSNADGYGKTTSNTYTNNTTNWHLGRLTSASVTATAP